MLYNNNTTITLGYIAKNSTNDQTLSVKFMLAISEVLTVYVKT